MIPETDSRDPGTETGSLETEKRVHRIHGTLETGLHKDAPQPGGPHKRGRRIYNNFLGVEYTQSFTEHPFFVLQACVLQIAFYSFL